MKLQLARLPCAIGADHRQTALTPRDAALLAWLALEGPTPRARLAALLWPESEADAARNALRQRLFRLKHQFGSELVVGSTTLALAEGVTHDLEDADSVLGDDEHAEHGPEFAAWLAQQRLRRRDRARQTLAELSDMAERARDWPDALSHAQELLSLDALSEDAHRRVIRLHYLGGDRAAALLAFDRCERVLKDEIGARPAPETLALLHAVDQSQRLSGQVVVAPPAVLRPPRLVGRQRELNAALTAWQQGQIVSLSGEAGLGKTRLLQELAGHCRDAVLAQARPGDSVVPYSAFARLLRALVERAPSCLQRVPEVDLVRLLPETVTSAVLMAAPIGAASPGRPLGLQRAVAAVLQAAAASGVDALLFDDLHFADDASLDLLLALLRPAGEAMPALRFALAQRPAEGSPKLAAMHEALLEEQTIAPITLHLLDEAQLRELVESLSLEGIDAAALAKQLFHLTGGNPLFALETLRQGIVESRLGTGGVLPRPTSVAWLMERRLQRLSVPALRLARCAAIAGQDFNAPLATHVLGVAALDLTDAWVELEAAQVLRDGGFAHDLIHDAVLASVPAALAQPLHAEIAAYLGQHGGAPGRVAQHWRRARQWAQAGAAYQAAALGAHQSGRRAEQAALLGEAAECFEHCGDTAARFEALLARADVLGEFEQAGKAQASVAAAQAAAQDDEQRLRALLVQLQSTEIRGESAETLQLAPEAIARARALGRTELMLRFALVLSGALTNTRRAAEAVALLEPLRAAVEASADDELHWQYWSALALSLDYANRLGDAVPVWQAALSDAQRLGRHDLVWQSTINLGSTQAKIGRVRLALELSLQARQRANIHGELAQGRALQSQTTLAHRLRDLGRYAEALPLLEEAHEFFRHQSGSSHDLAGVEHRLAQAFQQLGQPARSQSLLAGEHAALSPGLALMRQLHRADLAHLLGHDAVTPVRAALAMAPDRDDVYHRLATLFASAIVPPDEGESLATGLAAWASAHQRHGMALAGHVRAAGCALALGAAQRAQPHVEAALRLAPEFEPDSFYLPELWLTAARVFAACGNDADAQVALRDGAAWVMRVHDQHVPDAFRASFLQRNAINRGLLALAGRMTTP